MELLYSTFMCLVFIVSVLLIAKFLSRRFAKAGIAEFLINLFQNRTQKKK